MQDATEALSRKFPKITRSDVAIRHLRVLVALGFAENQTSEIFLMPDGQRFLDTKDLQILRAALLGRVYGAKELLGALREGPVEKAQVPERLQSAGLARATPTQAKRLVEWFRASRIAEQVERDKNRLRLVEDRVSS